ncbi:IS66 family transposase [Methanospirillum stamsii]|uniref:IS66 family transposase n=1 Tax=Methanospirillum stamsii TaxID=1277351 RepID=A0A2V2N060_9EURY|nr:IS66 family transposase [Methanospirillum stamsii]PWR69547.1 IS66 family transposase [Methanospirillum stamsii]
MEFSDEEQEYIQKSHPIIIEIISRLLAQLLLLREEICELKSRVRDLENRFNLNSTNSSIPPSKNPLNHKKISNSRVSRGNRPGGQTGHIGTTLSPVENPDIKIDHAPNVCSGCGATVQTKLLQFLDERQEAEIPPATILWIAHRIFSYHCPYCHTVTNGEFPRHITQKVQYGVRLTAYVAYLSVYQLIPVKRLTHILSDLHGCSISPGTVINMVERVGGNLEGFTDKIRELLIESPVIHTDETGMKVGKKKSWLHVASTKLLTLYGIFGSRGHAGIEALGVLPHYFGIAVHDFWDSYHKYPCNHAYCNAHILRELKRVEEETKQDWAVRMRELLLKAKKISEIFHDKDKLVGPSLIKFLNEEYSNIIIEGMQANPPPTPIKGKRGRRKQPHSRNLLERMQNHQTEILLFLTNPLAPFDNNLAERDIRMPKLKMKISGLFRSEKGAQAFSRIRSYVSTMQKNEISIIDGLMKATMGDPWIPDYSQKNHPTLVSTNQELALA